MTWCLHPILFIVDIFGSFWCEVCCDFPDIALQSHENVTILLLSLSLHFSQWLYLSSFMYMFSRLRCDLEVMWSPGWEIVKTMKRKHSKMSPHDLFHQWKAKPTLVWHQVSLHCKDTCWASSMFEPLRQHLVCNKNSQLFRNAVRTSMSSIIRGIFRWCGLNLQSG